MFNQGKRKKYLSKISSFSYSPISANEVEEKLRYLNVSGLDLEELKTTKKSIPAAFREKYIDSDVNALDTWYKNIHDYKERVSSFISTISNEVDAETVDSLALKWIERSDDLLGILSSAANAKTVWNSIAGELQADLSLEDLTIQKLNSLLGKWNAKINDFFEWGHCNSLRNWFADKPYTVDFVDRILSGEDIQGIVESFKASVISSLISMFICENPLLHRYESEEFSEMVENLKNLEKDYREAVVENVHSQLDSIISKRKKDSEQLKQLRTFITSNGKRRTVKSLFDSCAETISDICPCFLMSPLSVSQYLKAGKQIFDLVIFDEASQIQTCKAVGAIARGTALIVVGDSKQMPPTSFFSKNFDSGDEEYNSETDSLSDMDSILDDCINIGMPELRLTWHYRSTNESLIQFSNSHYYNNKLKTYPSVDSGTSKVIFKKVRGWYQPDSKDPNPAEVEAIVQEIIRRLSNPALAKDSIGVITFNEKQQNQIINSLENYFEKEKELSLRAHWDESEIDCPDKLIVKNLENIQGDERDVIMLSVTFGKSQSGRFVKNFGPIGKSGGEKRLNVAFSRAKKEMLVFSIIDVAEFSTVELSSRGARDLRDFLKYASQRSAIDSRKKETSKIKEELSVFITEKGFETEIDVGLSEFKIDIGVKDPVSSDFFCGILLDGENMLSAKLSNDRFILRRTMLARRGWKTILVRSVDWMENREKVLESLASDIDALLLEYRKESENKNTAVINETVSSEEEIETSFAGEYRVCRLSYDETPSNKFLQINERYIRERFARVIMEEGPIIDDLLEKRVANSYGIKKRGTNIRKYLDEILNSMDLLRTSQTDIHEESHYVYWPDKYRDFEGSVEENFKLFRNPPQEDSDLDNSMKRSIFEYPQVEIRNGMSAVIRKNGPSIKENLLSETSLKMGFKRGGSDIQETLELVLRTELEKGFFVENNETGRVSLAEEK